MKQLQPSLAARQSYDRAPTALRRRGSRVEAPGLEGSSSPCSWHKRTDCPNLQCSATSQPEDEAPCERKPDPPAGTSAARVTGSLHQLSPEQPCFPGSPPACRRDRGSPHGPGRGQQREPSAPFLPGGADLARAPSGAGLPPAGTALRAPSPAEKRLGPLIPAEGSLGKEKFLSSGTEAAGGSRCPCPVPRHLPPSSAGPAARSTRGRLWRAGPRRHLGPRLPWCGGGRRLGAGPARLAAGCLPPAR